MDSRRLAAIVRSLVEHDMVQVASTGASKPRVVRVTGVSSDDTSYRVYTSSGKTRPGAVSGGAITLHQLDGRVTFQPTLAQQAHPILALSRVGVAH